MKLSRSPRFHASTCAFHTALTSAAGSPARDGDDAHALISNSSAVDDIFNLLRIYAARGFIATCCRRPSCRGPRSIAERLIPSCSPSSPLRSRRRVGLHSSRQAYRDGAVVLFRRCSAPPNLLHEGTPPPVSSRRATCTHRARRRT